jgi:hypothetical protein
MRPSGSLARNRRVAGSSDARTSCRPAATFPYKGSLDFIGKDRLAEATDQDRAVILGPEQPG